MRFSELAGAFEAMEATSKRTELTGHLVDLFGKAPAGMVARITYLLQGKLRPDFEGVELGVAEKLAIRAVSKSSGAPVGAIEGELRRSGDIGSAAAEILRRKSQTTFVAQDITVERVYDTLVRIAGLEGSRSQDMKMKYISSLLNDASPGEARHILRLLLGTMRLGVAENTVMDALAVTFTGDKANRGALERAYNVSSDLGAVAEAVAAGGLAAAEGFGMALFSPVRPMLADRVRSQEEAVGRLGGEFAAEYKLDGERVQIHLGGGRVELFSRRLEKVARHYPDIVERIPGSVRAGDAILEAEVVAVNEGTGEFLPFQELMHRRRKHGVERAVEAYPIAVNFFDVLYRDGSGLLGKPYSERRRALEEVVAEDDYARLVPMEIARSAEEVQEIMESAINAGAEGLMLKRLDRRYQAGSRGSSWLKLKREYQNELGDSLDLAVVGGYFGRGRRTGIYGTLLLATYDPGTGDLTSICKVGTGFTDEDLDRLYQILSPRASVKRHPRVRSGLEAEVWFEPGPVVEVVASEITLSPVHVAGKGAVRKGAGFALRFPKFTGRIREEKGAEDASTNDEVLALYRGQRKVAPGGAA